MEEGERELNAALMSVAACLRRALEEVEALAQADVRPGAKIEGLAGALEALGEGLEDGVYGVRRRLDLTGPASRDRMGAIRCDEVPD